MPSAIRVAPRAAGDIDAMVRWLARHSSVAAVRWQAGISTAIDSLSACAERCPLAEEAGELGLDLRELLHGHRRGVYRILFTIEGETIIIHRVRHASQDHLASDDL